MRLAIPQTRLAERIGVPIQRVDQIVNGRRGITADTAVRLGKFLRTSAEFWMNLQSQHDLAKVHLDEKIESHG